MGMSELTGPRWIKSLDQFAGHGSTVRYSPPMHPAITDVGDSLRDVIARVAIALMQGDVDEAWAAVESCEATEACAAWDRLRGRHSASQVELERGRQELLAMMLEQVPLP